MADLNNFLDQYKQSMAAGAVPSQGIDTDSITKGVDARLAQEQVDQQKGAQKGLADAKAQQLQYFKEQRIPYNLDSNGNPAPILAPDGTMLRQRFNSSTYSSQKGQPYKKSLTDDSFIPDTATKTDAKGNVVDNLGNVVGLDPSIQAKKDSIANISAARNQYDDEYNKLQTEGDSFSRVKDANNAYQKAAANVSKLSAAQADAQKNNPDYETAGPDGQSMKDKLASQISSAQDQANTAKAAIAPTQDYWNRMRANETNRRLAVNHLEQARAGNLAPEDAAKYQSMALNKAATDEGDDEGKPLPSYADQSSPTVTPQQQAGATQMASLKDDTNTPDQPAAAPDVAQQPSAAPSPVPQPQAPPVDTPAPVAAAPPPPAPVAPPIPTDAAAPPVPPVTPAPQGSNPNSTGQQANANAKAASAQIQDPTSLPVAPALASAPPPPAKPTAPAPPAPAPMPPPAPTAVSGPAPVDTTPPPVVVARPEAVDDMDLNEGGNLLKQSNASLAARSQALAQKQQTLAAPFQALEAKKANLDAINTAAIQQGNPTVQMFYKNADGGKGDPAPPIAEHLQQQYQDYFGDHDALTQQMKPQFDALAQEGAALDADGKLHDQAVALYQGKQAAEEKAQEESRQASLAKLREQPMTAPFADQLDALHQDTQTKAGQIQSQYPEGPARDAAMQTLQEQQGQKVDDIQKGLQAATNPLNKIQIGQELLQAATGATAERSLEQESIDPSEPGAAQSAAALQDTQAQKDAVAKKYGLTPEEATAMAVQAAHRPYSVDDSGKLNFAPLSAGNGTPTPDEAFRAFQGANKDGLLDPAKVPELQQQLRKAKDNYDALVAAAGGDTELKAVLSGAGKGGAFMAAFAGGARVGSMLPGVESNPYTAALVPAITGLTAATAATMGYDATMKKLGGYFDAINSLNASATLNPGYAQAGELGSFALAPTSILSKAAWKSGEALTPAAISSVQKYSKLASVAADAAGDAGTSAAVDSARSLAGMNAVLKTAGGAATGGALFTAGQYAFDAARYTLADKLGIQHEELQTPGLSDLATNVGLAVLLHGQGIAFKDYSPTDVASIITRAQMHKNAGRGYGVAGDPADILKAYQDAGVNTSGWSDAQKKEMTSPLTPEEIAVYKNAEQKTQQLKDSGQLDNAKGLDFAGARQASVPTLTGNKPIVSAAVKPVAGEEGAAPQAGLPAIHPDIQSSASEAELEANEGHSDIGPATVMKDIASPEVQSADDLTESELRQVGLTREGSQESNKIAPYKPVGADGKTQPAMTPLVHVGDDGKMVATPEGLKLLKDNFPATHQLVSDHNSAVEQSRTISPKESANEAAPSEASPKASAEPAESGSGVAQGAAEASPAEAAPDAKAEALKIAADHLEEQGKTHNVGPLREEAEKLKTQVATKPATSEAPKVEQKSEIQPAKEDKTGDIPVPWNNLDSDEKELLHDKLSKVLEKRGTVRWEDIPTDLKNKIGTTESASIKKALAENPKSAIEQLLSTTKSNVPDKQSPSERQAGPDSGATASPVLPSGESETVPAKKAGDAIRALATGPKKNVTNLIADAVDEHGPAFAAVKVGETVGSAGIEVANGELHIDPKKLVAHLTSFGDKSKAAIKKRLADILYEELKHRTSTMLDVDAEGNATPTTDPKFAKALQELWDAVPADTKKTQAAAYYKSTKQKFPTPWHAKHEWWADVQAAAERGEIPHDIDHPGLLEKFKKVIAAYKDALLQWIAKMPAELRAKFNEAVAQVNQLEAKLKGMKEPEEPLASAPVQDISKLDISEVEAGKSYWLATDGKLIPVSKNNHNELAVKLGFTADSKGNDELYRQGYKRVITGKDHDENVTMEINGSRYDNNPALTPRQKGALDRAQSNGTIIDSDTPIHSAPTVDSLAHEAATSPHNNLAEPTEAQREAENYKVGHVKISGLPISIENPAGSHRRPEWPALQDHYGRILRTEGADKDHLDVFVKQGTPLDYNGPVYVVNQKNPSTGKFDETKTILGAASSKDALNVYQRNYSPSWKGYDGMHVFPSVDAYKQALKGEHSGPVGQPKEQPPKEQPLSTAPAQDSGAVHPAFYSQLERTIEEKMPNVASLPQVKAIVEKGGAKAEEVKWSGVVPWLESKGNRVTKAEVLDYLKGEGAVRFEEHRLGDRPIAEGSFMSSDGVHVETTHGRRTFANYDEAHAAFPELKTGLYDKSLPKPKYSQYQLPGGENYREVVLAMPQKDVSMALDKTKALYNIDQDNWGWREGRPEWGDLSNELQLRRAKESGNLAAERASYKSSHFPDIPNYVAHMRLNDRVDADGQPGTLMEELQSDRHQQGREKGYKGDPEKLKAVEREHDNAASALASLQRLSETTPSNTPMADKLPAKLETAQKHFDELTQRVKELSGTIPDAPFRTTWPLQLFKRALREAVENGKKWIGWTTGETQAERYDLSKQISKVLYNEDTQRLTAWDKNASERRTNGRTVIDESNVSREKLADYIGKDAANKILAKETDSDGDRELAGLDLKVGGEGMKGFYDNILPKEVGKYVKQWGAGVEKGSVSTPKNKKRTDDLNDAELLQELHRNGDSVPIHRISITPEMERSVRAGQPLFSAPNPPVSGTNANAEERLGRELPDRDVIGDEAANKEADRRMKEDPEIGSKLTDEYFKDETAPIDIFKSTILIREAAKRQREYEKAVLELDKNPSDPDLQKTVQEKEEANLKSIAVRSGINNNLGRVFRGTQLAADNEFSWATIQENAKAANGGKPLDEKETAKFKDLWKKHVAATEKIEAMEAQKAEDEGIKKVLTEQLAAKKNGSVRKGTGNLKSNGKTALERWKARQGQPLSASPLGTNAQLYRAGDSDERGIKAFSSWSEDKSTAEAYQDNPGFGGKTLRKEKYPLNKVLEANTTNRRGMVSLAEELGFSKEDGNEWFDNGWRYPWEESSKIRSALKESGYDAIKYPDDFPEGATTIVPLKDQGFKSEALASSPNASEDFKDLSEFGASLIDDGHNDVAAFSNAMEKMAPGAIAEHGADALFNASKAIVDADKAATLPPAIVKTIAEKREKDAAKITSVDLTNLAKSILTNDGRISTEPALIDAMHEELKKEFPKITPDNIRKAWTNFEKSKLPSTDPVDVLTTDLHQQSLLQLKLDAAIKENRLAKKTGAQRQKPSTEARFKQKELMRIVKDKKLRPVDPATQLANSETKMVNHLNNRKADLERQIAAKVKDKVARGEPATSPDIVRLKGEVRQLSRALENIHSQTSPEGKRALMVKNANDTLRDYKQRIAKMTREINLPGTEKVEGLAEDRDNLTAAYDGLRHDLEDMLAAQREKDGIDPLKSLTDTWKKRQASAKKKPAAIHKAALHELVDAHLKEENPNFIAQATRLGAKAGMTPDDIKQLDQIVSAERDRRDAMGMEALNRRTATNVTKLASKLEEMKRSGELPAKQTPREKKFNADLTKAKVEQKAIQNAIKEEAMLIELRNRPGWKKFMDETSKFFTSAAIGGYHTIFKVMGFDLARSAELGAGDVLGLLMSGTQLARDSKYEASSMNALGKYYKEASTTGMKEAWQQLTTGTSPSHTMHDKRAIEPKRWHDWIAGNLHDAEKRIVLVGGAAMYYQKAKEHAERNKLPFDEVAELQNAYDYGRRNALAEHNGFAQYVKSGIKKFEDWGGFGANLLSASLQSLFTKKVYTIPSNYVKQTLERTPVGFGIGLGRWATYSKEKGELDPGAADAISRLVKFGAIGTAMFVLGIVDALRDPKDRVFGGYYQPGDKRHPQDVDAGRIRLFGHQIPSFLMDNPLTEVAQMGSTLVRVLKGKAASKVDGATAAGASGIASLTGLLEHAPLVGTVPDLLKMGEPKGFQKEWFRAVSGLVPMIFANLAEDMDRRTPQGQPTLNPFLGDGVKRDPKTLWDNVKMKVPGLRQTVPTKSSYKLPSSVHLPGLSAAKRAQMPKSP